jgi:hypothetical protein
MRYDTLSADQNAKLASTIRDLRDFHLAGIALVRGKANAIEEASLSKLANPGKTKHIDKEDRGILAVQKMIDRASGLLRLALGKVVENYNMALTAEVPRESCIQARNGVNTNGDETVKAAWATDYAVVQAAKTTWLALKTKYSEEQLASPGSLTLEAKATKERAAKVKSDLAIFNALRKMFPDNNIAVLTEMTKHDADPANYKLPEVAKVVEVEVVEALKAAQAN